MKKISAKGFTLVEILVATLVAGIVGTVAYKQLDSVMRYSSRTQDHFELEKSKVSIGRELQRLFSRSRRIIAQAIPAIPAPGFGYSVNGTGAIVFDADLRPCIAEGAAITPAVFNPMTANAANPLIAALNSAYTLVTLLCCPGPADPSPTMVNNPYGGNFAVPTACRRGRGITLSYQRGGRSDQRCLGDFGLAGASYVGMRFTPNLGLDQARVTHTFANLFVVNNAGVQSIAPNTGTYTPSRPGVVFQLTLFTSDTMLTGESKGVQTAQSDQQAVSEFYGTLGNQVTNRYTPCGRGVQD